MGLLSKLIRAGIPQASSGASPVSASASVIERTDEQVDMLRSGYRENWDHEIFPPDTVWFNARSKAYHSSDCCAGYVIADAVPFPEAEGVRRGLHRCKKCEWRGDPPPEPCERPAAPVRPISVASVRPARKGEFK